MIKIIEIKRKGRNFLIFLDNGGEFLLNGKVKDKYGIKPGVEFEYEVLEDIKYESDLIRAQEYVNYLLARRSYSIGLIKSKLEEKRYSKRVVENILRYFIEKGLLDDTTFAREMTGSILRNKPAGRDYIIARLRQKKIPRPTAVSIVDEFFGTIDEVELALKLLRSRWRYFSKFELETARRKAYNYLSRRSIGYQAAKKAFEKILLEEK